MKPSDWYEEGKNVLNEAYDRLKGSVPSDRLKDSWDQIRTNLVKQLSDFRQHSTDQMPDLMAFLHTENLRQWMDAVYEGTKTEYDKAMDAAFVAKLKEGELGYSAGKHRLFDEGHTLWDSFDRAQDAVKADSEMTEVIEWAQSYMKDLTTPNGVPVMNMDPQTYDQWVDATAEAVPGLEEQYLFDLLNFDAMEVLAAELSVIGVVFALSDEEQDRLAEILGAMGINSILAANPIMGMMTAAVTAYAYWRHEKVKGDSVVKGGSIATLSSLIFAALSLHVLVELVIVIVVAYQFRERIFENEKFISWLKETMKNHSPDPKQLVSVLPDSYTLTQNIRKHLSIES